MIGTRFNKPLNEDSEKLYAECAEWCNENNATIEDKGEYYECVAIPAPTLEELKAQKLLDVDSWTASKITGGFVSYASGEAVTYDSDKDTQLTMQGIALNVNTPLFEQEYPNGCPIRGYTVLGGQDKQVIMLNAEQVLKWCADLSMHIGSCKQAGWAKQEEVKACKTKEQLEKIEW